MFNMSEKHVQSQAKNVMISAHSLPRRIPVEVVFFGGPSHTSKKSPRHTSMEALAVVARLVQDWSFGMTNRPVGKKNHQISQMLV